MDKFEALIGDVVLATLVAVVEAETDYGMLDMNCRKIADTKQKMLSAYTAIEAENKELKAWVREAVTYVRFGVTSRLTTGEHYCMNCHQRADILGRIKHTNKCVAMRGEKLLEGADKEEVI